MKRKVIQIAESTQLISIPRQWGKKYNIKKGDELEVTEKGNKLEISSEKDVQLDKVSINISGLDRTSVIYSIRSAYRKGYNVIEIFFEKPYVKHFRLGTDVKLISVIHEEVNRLVGVEIIEQKEAFCVIKDISNASFKEFDTVLRRIFLLFLDALKEIFNGMKIRNIVIVETMEEKHNSITKFISYALRLLNKGGFSDQHKNSLLYTILVMFDKMTDILKYGSRMYIAQNIKISKEGEEIIDNIYNGVQLYYELFYKYDPENIVKIYENRDKVIKKIKKIKENISRDELILLCDLRQVLEYITGITEARLSLLD